MREAIQGPLGSKAMTYADYAASGQPVAHLEAFMLRQVMPFYANTHTDASDCGRYIKSLYHQARVVVAAEVGANRKEYAVIFTGSGATAGLSKLATMLLLEHRQGPFSRSSSCSSPSAASRPGSQSGDRNSAPLQICNGNAEDASCNALHHDAADDIYASNTMPGLDAASQGSSSTGPTTAGTVGAAPEQLKLMLRSSNGSSSGSSSSNARDANGQTPVSLPQVAPPAPPLPVVFVGPLEHHSNLLLWRHLPCQLVVIPSGPDGRADLAVLEEQLVAHSNAPLKIGSFSAGSNVTGITEDVEAVSEVLHRHGGLACFDYAGAGSHVPISMAAPEGRPLAYKDAIALSPHKMVGGPGCCGILVAARRLFCDVPTVPGGGTVEYVSPDAVQYMDDEEHREEAGTPNILGAIRCGAAFALRASLSARLVHLLEAAAAHALVASLSTNPNIVLLGAEAPAYHDPDRMAIVSFLIRVPQAALLQYQSTGSGTPLPDGASINARTTSDNSASSARAPKGSDESAVPSRPYDCPVARQWGPLLHHHLVCKVLNDVYGIQCRSGCSCAALYGQQLLRLSPEEVDANAAAVADGLIPPRAGWTRVSVCFAQHPLEIQYIAAAVHQSQLARSSPPPPPTPACCAAWSPSCVPLHPHTVLLPPPAPLAPLPSPHHLRASILQWLPLPPLPTLARQPSPTAPPPPAPPPPAVWPG